MGQVCTLDEVKKIWTVPGGKTPCTTTIWKRTRAGLIPKPRLVGNTNLYNRDEVIRLRNQAWGIE